MEAFVRMYKAGLIYRGMRIVNWDPKMQTTVSDDEIEWKEETSPFYYLKYGPFTIATARPETKFGDKYVVMHPDDKRYAQYTHNQKIELEWINGPITATVIKDPAIDMEFGTGVMTITPWHDTTDFEIAERHGLDKEPVIDERGILLPIAGEFAGQHIKKARPMIVEKLQKNGLIEKIDEAYTHNVATNSRGGGTIEPQIKMQWFVAVNQEFEQIGLPAQVGKKTTLRKLMHDAVENGQVKITPDHFEKTYYHWVDNLRDWCISRQIWFGHRIPVWYKGENIHVGAEPPSANWQKDGWEQDPDTLDTWFSSGLWTFSTLGWPEETADLKTYHPTSVLETGYDILFFWIARMVLMSGFLLGEVPFKQVYLHGLVRDAQGRKMSKSLGNIIDPLDMIAKYGADALRLSLILGAAPGNDTKLAEDRIKGYKNFANKLWNITRFVLENSGPESESSELVEEDKASIAEVEELAKKITIHLDDFRPDLAADELYHYIWDKFAAFLIEDSKRVFREGTDEEKASRKKMLFGNLLTLLRLLHPFMPYITEEIWQSLPLPTKNLLMVEEWPVK